MNRPIYAWAEKVEFKPFESGEVLEGYIEVVDAFGTLFDNREPCYDISVPSKNNAIYKNIPESYIRKKLTDKTIIKGILQHFPQNNKYGIQYSPEGYCAVLDDPFCMKIRSYLSGQWVPVYLADLEKMVGKSVELLHEQPYILLNNLIHSHQDDSFMIYEIYREDANVVLYEGGFALWEPEKLILRSAKHVASSEYGSERVFRWDVVNSVMRICLGPVHLPSERTLEIAKHSLDEIERVKKGNK